MPASDVEAIAPTPSSLSNNGHSSQDKQRPTNTWNPATLESLSRSVVRKYDLRLIPIVFIAYTIFWLDRANISLARISGLEKDLRLDGAEFNISLGVFFAAYILLNIPANLVLRKLGGGVFLPGLIVCWGIATLGSGFVKDFAGLCASRVAVGAAEAGFIGGVLLWLGFFYTNEELVARIGIILSSSPLAGSLGGLLAGGLSQIQAGGYSRWPWIFFIEGAMTISVGITAFFIMPDNPEKASFLTAEEKLAARDRMILLDSRSFSHRIASISSSQSINNENDTNPEYQLINANLTDKLSASTWRRAILHPITIIMTLGCFMSIACVYSYNLFLPTLLAEMGFRDISNPLMTVPPNAVSFAYTILVTQWSRRRGHVAIFLIFSAVMVSLGYCLLLIGSFAGGVSASGIPRLVTQLQYTGTFLVGAGINACTPLALSWVCVNANPHYVRAIVLGIIISIGNLASFVASFTYIKTNAPRYAAGHSINFALATALVFLNVINLLWMRYENGRRDRGDRDHRLKVPQGMSRLEHEISLGWDHPRFRFNM